MRTILIGLLCASAWGQSPVVVTGPLKMANADGWTGDLTVSWPSMKCGTTPVVKGSKTFRVTNGVVPTIQVYPTASCGNNRYTVNYTGGTIAYWTIPTTPSSQSITSIETLTAPALPVIPPFAIGQVSGLQAALDSLALLIPGSAVPSVFGRTGPITATSGDYTTALVTESGNLYFTNQRALDALASALALKANLASPTFSGAFDASASTTTKPIKTGTTLPASCGTGETFFDTDATAGSNVFTCVSNTWTVISSGEIATAGTGLVKLLSEFYVDNTVTPTVAIGAGAPAGACTGVDRYIDTTAHAEYFCEVGTWRAGGSSYTLPTASASVIGGIKIGSGLSIDGAGVVTASGGGGGTTGLYSGTLNFGAIPDLGCAALTLAATGLTTGKTLALSLPAALETGLIGTAFASASDVATVRLCNVSGASVDPASATFAVRDMDALGYLTASATINYGSIGDGNCAASTITLSGAAAGDNVAAGWPAALEAGLTGSMFVSAADTVAVRLCNFSGAAVDPASATFRAAITR